MFIDLLGFGCLAICFVACMVVVWRLWFARLVVCCGYNLVVCACLRLGGWFVIGCVLRWIAVVLVVASFGCLLFICGFIWLLFAVAYAVKFDLDLVGLDLRLRIVVLV